MTDNVEFTKLKRELGRCSTENEKIEILRELVKLNPSYPPLLQQRTAYKRELQILERKSSGRKSVVHDLYDIPHYSLQIGLIGAGNSGKSTLLTELTDARPEISPHPYSTYRPVVGNLEYKDVKLQLVEIPSIKVGETVKNPGKFRLIRQLREGILVVAYPEEVPMIEEELLNANIRLNRHTQRYSADKTSLPSFLAYRDEKPDHHVLATVEIDDLDILLEEMYIGLHIQRIYPRTTNGIEKSPVIFFGDEPVTVEVFARKLDRRFPFYYTGARIWGRSAHHEGQRVGMNHVLYDGDNVYLVRK